MQNTLLGNSTTEDEQIFVFRSGGPPGYSTIQEDQYHNGLLNGLAAAKRLKVQQRIRWLEAVSQGMCEQSNKYQVYNADTDEHLFNVQEGSECCNRCCCAPHHSFDLNIIPPNMGWGEENFQKPVLMTRDGCCSDGMCSKCLGCWSCNETCQNVATVWPDAGQDKQKFRMEEKLCNGCKPEIVIYAVDGIGPGQDLPMALLSAPCCFGGCYELCSDFYFEASTIDSNLQIKGEIGDIAKIKKVRPHGCGEMVMQCCTDIDNFELEFQDNFAYNNDPNFKACLLSALFYLDYMFFEMDNGMCSCSDGKLYITLFNCYCSGCICPCVITLSGNGGD